MPTKLTWRDESKYAKRLLAKIKDSDDRLAIFPGFTKLDGRTFIDLNDYED